MKTIYKVLIWALVAVVGYLLMAVEVYILGFILSFIGSAAVLIIVTQWLNSTNRK